MSVHTLSRIHMARGALAQAAKHFQTRSTGRGRVLMGEAIDLLKKELREQRAVTRRKRRA